MSPRGAARRAHDAARRRPRDDRLGAGVDVRAARSRAGRRARGCTSEIDAGDDDAYLDATIQETLRRRPVLPNAAPRLVKQPVDDRRLDVPRGRRASAPTPTSSTTTRRSTPTPTRSGPSASSTSPPGTYTWIPFGGGRRRCLGASFALLEMRIVLRAVLSRVRGAPRPARSSSPAGAASRSAPATARRAVLRDRVQSEVAPERDLEAA